MSGCARDLHKLKILRAEDASHADTLLEEAFLPDFGEDLVAIAGQLAEQAQRQQRSIGELSKKTSAFIGTEAPEIEAARSEEVSQLVSTQASYLRQIKGK